MKVCGLVLAAGLSSRMGDFKPLMDLNGKPVIVRTVESMLSAGVSPVTVVLGNRADEVTQVLQAAIPPEAIRIALNPDYATTDMLTSIKIGIRALPEDCAAFFLLPGDMPAVRKSTYDRIRTEMEATHAAAVFPLIQGFRRHPPLIRTDIIDEILAFAGSGGLKSFWNQYKGVVAQAPVDDPGCWLDMDTLEDYQRLAAYLKGNESESGSQLSGF